MWDVTADRTRRLLEFPRTCADRVLEAVWQRRDLEPVNAGQLTWPVEAAALGQVVVRWPMVYDWPARALWGEQLLAGLKRFVRTELVDIPQTHNGVIGFELVVGGRKHFIGIDVSDYPDLNENAYQNCDLMFKFQFDRGGYGARDRVLPGGFINADPIIYHYLDRLRLLRDRGPEKYDVYGRFELTMEKRARPINLLRASDRFMFWGGQGKVRYSRYLREVAQARVCIDLAGTASITFRLVDYLAVGACIVGPPHACCLPVPLVDGEHLAYCKEDFSDFEEKCAHYVHDNTARENLIRSSRAFFDAYLHRDQQTSYYLHHCLKRLG